ncbi:MAG: phosphopantetheine-binding protein [Candidatus Omnitrophica bacterium]|nr:phosphopantetheine-binding protein [Candidatus Omnitrophota bacterium]
MGFFKKKLKVPPEEGEQLLCRLRKALSSEPKFENKKIDLNTNFKEDLNSYSLDAIFIVMALEKEFDIEISDEDAEKFLTAGNVIEYLYGTLRQDDAPESAT